MRHLMQLRSVSAVTVVAEGTGPDAAIRVEWTRHDALLEALDLVGVDDRINTQR
jgi:hypothetical protein